MIFTAFIDESGTHANSPVTIMAGCFGNARQWELFERRLKNLQRDFGFSIFHAKTIKESDGEFADWSKTKKMRLITALSDLIDEELGGAFTTHLSNEEYKRDCFGDTRPRKLRLDTKYGLCFRLCMTYLLEATLRRKPSHRGRVTNRDTLNVVLEMGAENAGDAVRIFNDMKEKALPSEACDLLGTISFGKKEICPPLAAADFLAHTSFMTEKHIKRGALTFNDLTAERPNKSIVHLITPTEGALALARQNAFEDEEKRLSHGRRRLKPT